MARKGKKAKKRRGGFRAKARSAGRRARRGFRKIRRTRLGLIGKTGVGVAGVVPVAWSAVEASAPWMDPIFVSVSITGKLKHTIARFTNSLSIGFGLGPTFTGTIDAVDVSTHTNIPGGGWIKTTTVGFGLVITDFITGMLFKFSGKSVPRTKIMGKQVLSG